MCVNPRALPQRPTAPSDAVAVGIVAGLVCMPAVGRWLDRGACSTVVAASMPVRALAAPAGHVWLFATAALFLGIGNQAWPAAHAALVATVAHGRERDTALAGVRVLRNAALSVGALLAANAWRAAPPRSGAGSCHCARLPCRSRLGVVRPRARISSGLLPPGASRLVSSAIAASVQHH